MVIKEKEGKRDPQPQNHPSQLKEEEVILPSKKVQRDDDGGVVDHQHPKGKKSEESPN